MPSPIPQNPTLPEYQLVPESIRARKLWKVKILANGNLPDESPQEYVDKGVVRDKKMDDINVGDSQLPLYFGIEKVDTIDEKLTPEFVGTLKKEIEATPGKCRHAPRKKGVSKRGHQHSFGKSTEPTNKPATKCDNVRIVTPEDMYKQMPPGGSTPRFNASTISMPYEVKHRFNAKTNVLEKMVGELVMLLADKFEHCYPEAFERQRNSIAPMDRWPNEKSPFNKCNLNVNRGTQMHYDKGNARGSVCVMLVIGEFEGGEQVIVNGANDSVTRISNEHGNVCMVQFDRLYHGVLETTSGWRVSILPYCNKSICEYYEVERSLQLEMGVAEFHTMYLAPVLAKHLCENTREHVHGRKEKGVPALSLPFDLCDYMRDVAGLSPTSTAYLLTHFNKTAVASVLERCKGFKGSNYVEEMCTQFKRLDSEGTVLGVGRFRNQELEKRLQLLSALEGHSTNTLLDDPLLWCKELVRDMEGIGPFGAMVVARVLLYKQSRGVVKDEAVCIDHGAKKFLVYYRVALKDMEAVTRQLQGAIAAAVAKELKAPKYSVAQQRRLRKKNTPEEEVTASKYTVVEQTALTKLLCRWMSFLEMEQMYCETLRRMKKGNKLTTEARTAALDGETVVDWTEEGELEVGGAMRFPDLTSEPGTTICWGTTSCPSRMSRWRRLWRWRWRRRSRWRWSRRRWRWRWWRWRRRRRAVAM